MKGKQFTLYSGKCGTHNWHDLFISSSDLGGETSTYKRNVVISRHYNISK